MTKRIAEFIVKHRLLVLLAFIAFTLFFAYEASKVPFRTNFPDLIPKHAYTDLAKKFEGFGGSNRVTITLAVKEGDIFNAPTLAKIIDISNTLQFMPGVDRNKVYSIGVSKIKNFKVTTEGLEFPSLMYPDPPKTREEIEQLKQNIFRNNLYYGRFVSIDTKAALVSGEFFVRDLNYKATYKALEEIRTKNTDKNTTVYIEGDTYLYGVISHYLNQTILIFALTLVGMIIAAFWFTRMARLVFVPLISMLLCGIWGLGGIGLLGFNIDPLVLVIPLLISARALSHSIQFGWRVQEEYVIHGNIKSACEKTISSLLYPGLAGIITDGIGILLIAIIPVPLMFKIGLSFFMWALTVIFVVLIFNPVIYLFIPALAVKKVDMWQKMQEKRWLDRVFSQQVFKMGKGRNAWAIVGLGIALAVAAGLISLNAKVGDIQPGSPLLQETSRYNQDVMKINSFFPGLIDPLMIVVDTKNPDGISQPEVMKAMIDFQSYLMTRPEVMGTVSIVDLVKNLNMKLYENNPKYYVLPNTSQGIYSNLFLLQGGGAEPGDFDQYYNDDLSATNVVAFLKDHTANTIEEVLSSCKQYLSQMKIKGYEFKLAMGRVGLVAATNESVELHQFMISVLAFGSTFLFCSLFFQSWMAGLILILPLGLANLFTLAYMSLASVGLSLQTLPVSTIAVGVGVDYGIYLLSRIKEEFEILGDMEAAIQRAISTSGQAVTVTGLIMVLGVGFWNFSTIKFQSDMGLLLSIVTFLHILGTLFILPALVRIFKPGFILKSYSIKGGDQNLK